MTRHLGASIFLSVSVVVFFAVVLYQPDGPPPPPLASASPSGPLVRAEPEARRAPPAPTPGIPLSEAVPPPPARAAEIIDRPPRPGNLPGREIQAAGTATASVRADPGLPVQPPPPPRHRSAARSAFTEVLSGETLNDVALRVYGSVEAAGTLWKANRDHIEHRDGPLDPGSLLRTP